MEYGRQGEGFRMKSLSYRFRGAFAREQKGLRLVKNRGGLFQKLANFQMLRTMRLAKAAFQAVLSGATLAHRLLIAGDFLGAVVIDAIAVERLENFRDVDILRAVVHAILAGRAGDSRRIVQDLDRFVDRRVFLCAKQAGSPSYSSSCPASARGWTYHSAL